ncbi:piggyBac transposable element-derived protein 4 [Halyomorpha halys]|uniref:piggyBac transposable element-derived protein 4 n=1 Tax=Halyomorpha halys TaxID=286706 RepID=UPI0006D4F871|nr:piggyBac transposable element-derived protein 3 [Halyomorpha halys]
MPKRPSKSPTPLNESKRRQVETPEEIMEVVLHSTSDEEDLGHFSDDSDDPTLRIQEMSSGSDSSDSEEERGKSGKTGTIFDASRNPPVSSTVPVPSDLADILPEPSGSNPLPDPFLQPSLSVPNPSLIIWQDDKPTIPPIPFTGNPGLKVKPPGTDPIHYFLMLAAIELMELIVARTNAYAHRLISAATAPRARILQWRDITVADFKKFLGLIYLMGHVVLPSHYHYWRQIFPYNFPTFPSVMSRDRFLRILRCLHFAEPPPTNSQVEPVNKIRPLLNFFHDKMESVYYPQKELSIHEAAMHKYGLKLYMLSQPNGLVLKILVTGSKDQHVSKRHAAKVVRYLIDNMLKVGHSIYADNLYNSVPLAHELLKDNTYLTGTLAKKRKDNPPEVIESKLNPGELKEKFTDKGISVFKWRAKRDVIMVSSEFDGHMESIQVKGKDSQKPEAIINYNKFIGGVDRSDQLLAYCPFERKTLRWYAKVGIHIFHIIMNNSYQLFQKNTGSNMKLLDFRDRVIVELLGGPPQLPEPVIHPAVAVHLPSKVSHAEKKRCRRCYEKKKRKDVQIICPRCPGKPGLCMEPCFREFHNYP